ncbi:MAG: zinc-ribbon domain-containing protein [Pseudomonadota bacterium]
MAIAKCRECGYEVSDSAKTCPKCGITRPVKKTTLFTKIIATLFILFIIGKIFSGQTASTQTNQPAIQSETPNQPVSNWFYSQEEDPMSKGKIYYAIVSSTNTVEFKFPYHGSQHAKLTLRISEKSGKDVLFEIEKGQILCRSYEHCTLLVRFDDEKAEKFSAVGAADNSTDTIFIHNYDRFLKRMIKAKRVRIAVNIYQEGQPIFEFDVTKFDPSKHKPK